MTPKVTGTRGWLGGVAAVVLMGCGGATVESSAEVPAGSGNEPSGTGGAVTAAPVLGEGAFAATWQELGVPGVGNRPDLASTPAGWFALSRRSVGDSRAPSAWESYLFRSSDGVRWQRVDVSDRNENLWQRGVAYGAGRYVLAGARMGGPGGSIFTSDDGEHWLESSVGIPAPDSEMLADVVYTGGRFFALGTSRAVLTSVDAVEWAPVDMFGKVVPYDIAFGGGRYLVVGSGNPQFSTDGISWQAAPLDCSLSGACIQAPDGQVGPAYQRRAVYAGGRYFIDQASSPDGEIWEALLGLYPEAEVDGSVLGRSTTDELVQWTAGVDARPLRSARYVDTLPVADRAAGMLWNGSVEPREVSSDNFPNGAPVPERLEFPLPNGADCISSTCVIVGERLFLVSSGD